MKKRFGIMFAVILGLILLAGHAGAAGVRYFTYTLQKDGTAKITGYKKEYQLLSIPVDTLYEASDNPEQGDLVLPSSLGGVPVTAIDRDALGYLSDYSRIMIPASMKTMDGNPFRNFGGVVTFVVSDGNTAFFTEDGVLIERETGRLVAYPLAKSDAAYTVPDSVTEIGEYAFASQQHLQEVTIPAGVKVIDPYAFSSIWNLNTVTFTEGLEQIGDYAFAHSGNVGQYTLPSTVKQIGNNPFNFCCTPTITVAEGNTAYEVRDRLLVETATQRVVCLAYNIYDTYTVPDGILEIGDSAFNGSLATTIILPDSLVRIGKEAFTTSFDSVRIEIPGNIQEIACNAIPYNVGTNEPQIQSVYELPEAYKASHPEEWEIEENDFRYRILEWGVSGKAVLVSYIGHDEEIEIMNTVTSGDTWFNIVGIEPGALAGNKTIRRVKYFFTPAEIPEKMFFGCVNLEYIFIVPMVYEPVTFGKECFAECKSLRTIKLNDAVAFLADDAFEGAYPGMFWEIRTVTGSASKVITDYMDTHQFAYSLDGVLKNVPQAAEGEAADWRTVNLKQAKPGDLLLFGSYEQDNDPEDGREPIEWIVLQNGGNSLILLSRKVIDLVRWNEHSGATWADSELRKWLNGDFYSTAFNTDEQGKIYTVRIKGETTASIYSPGDITEDKVHVLAHSEAALLDTMPEYYPADPTPYAAVKVDEIRVDKPNFTLGWFTRTVGGSPLGPVSVLTSSSAGIVGSVQGVRPVIYIMTK